MDADQVAELDAEELVEMAAERAAAAAQVFVDDLEHPVLGPDDERHLARSLRLRDGEQVVAADGDGSWRCCRFRTAPGPPARGAGGRLEPDGPVRHEPLPRFPLAVAFAPVKGDRPEWVVQKLTELGIDRVVPLVADRSVVRWEGERGRVVVARLRRIAREAACQSRRVRLPQVDEPTPLASLSGDPVLAEIGGSPPTTALRLVAIGPEGGWSPEERRRGLATLGLGPRVLRAETAAVAAGALLSALRDGMVRPGRVAVAAGLSGTAGLSGAAGLSGTSGSAGPWARRAAR
jgi:16S rRNA (uracil1498-N3)-methyltransferase